MTNKNSKTNRSIKAQNKTCAVSEANMSKTKKTASAKKKMVENTPKKTTKKTTKKLNEATTTVKKSTKKTVKKTTKKTTKA